jgi:general secretion pathway protein K
MKNMTKNIIGNQKGLALLLTLLITAVLTTVVVEFNYDANVNVDIAENYKNKLKASYLAKSGIKFAKLFLSANIDEYLGEDADDMEMLLHGQPIPLGDGFITINMDSEEGKINLNKLLVSDVTKKSFSILLNDIGADVSVYSSLVDWLDSDDDVSDYGGAESNYYETLPSPYPCKNGQMESISELKLVKGIDDNLYNELKKSCTIYSAGLININTAPKEVLLSLSEDLEEYDVNRIIEKREEEEFEGINELEYLGNIYNEIKGSITTEDKNYKIVSVGVVDEISYKITNYVEKGNNTTKLLYAKEE